MGRKRTDRTECTARTAPAWTSLDWRFLGWLVGACALATAACQTDSADLAEMGLVPAAVVANADELLPVDCLLPGQVRKLGRSQVIMMPRRPVRTTAHDCEIRGGEYVAYDRADYRTALLVWRGEAEGGDADAQNYVGEIYEKGLGIEPDYAEAASWYLKAADQNHAAAQVNLGQLYEQGRGVAKDWNVALDWYRKASGLGALNVEFLTSPPADTEPVLLAEMQIAVAGPSIQMIEPPIPKTRGIRLAGDSGVSSPGGNGPPLTERTLIGRVEAPGHLLALLVNDIPVPQNENGVFRTTVAVSAAGSRVVVSAIDHLGKGAERSFSLGRDGSWSTGDLAASAAPTPRKASGAKFGRYTAVVIGNATYQHLPQLATAFQDADAVADLLSERYGFKVIRLRDATRYDVLSTFNRLRASLTEDDSLLVYYAGHGELDEVNMRGHWLPVDAERDSSANWISNVAITDILNTMSVRHVLVVSDSCYSGALTRSAMANLDAGMSDEKQNAWLRAIASKRSRTALTSGGLAPVLDSGGGKHSVFARAFLEVLEQNGSVMSGQQLFQELAARVTVAAEEFRFEQLPQYAPIKFSGHESGDFLFAPQS